MSEKKRIRMTSADLRAALEAATEMASAGYRSLGTWVMRLVAYVVLLRAELKAAKKEKAILQAEVDRRKAAAAQPPTEKPPSDPAPAQEDAPPESDPTGGYGHRDEL